MCVWLHLSGSRWLQWQDRWSCNRMKLTLTLSGLLTHSHMIGSRWGGGSGGYHAFFPYFWFFPIFVLIFCLPYIVSSMSWPLFCCSLSVTAFPVSAFSFPSSPVLPSSLAPRWGSAVSAQLDPSEQLLALWAPVTVVCSMLSHLTGHLHLSINRLTSNLHVKSVLMNRFDKNNPAKRSWKGKGHTCLQCGNYTWWHTIWHHLGKFFWNG